MDSVREPRTYQQRKMLGLDKCSQPRLNTLTERLRTK